jgi:dTDP-4-amino-4,6-dideoxygalactose transaminase
MPSYHHGVEVEAVLDAGARPVFYRVDARMRVDLEDVERKIGPKTRALYLVHYLGFPGPMARFRRLAGAHGLRMIEDCALALLSYDGRRPLGSWGDASVFCLYKTLPVPHGGVLALNGLYAPEARIPTEPPPLDSTLSHFAASWLIGNPEFGRFGRKLHRMLQPAGKALFSRPESVPRVDPGGAVFERRHVNLGMSRLARRVLSAQDLAWVRELRRRNFLILLEELAGVSPPVFPSLPYGVCPLFYPLLVADKERVMGEMERAGIQTVDFWRHGHPSCPAGEYPETERLRQGIVELPCHQDLSEEMVYRIARAAKAALKQERETAVSA